MKTTKMKLEVAENTLVKKIFTIIQSTDKMIEKIVLNKKVENKEKANAIKSIIEYRDECIRKIT